MFSVHTTLEELKTATITGHFKFGFVFEKNLRREITSWRHRFQNVFSPQENGKLAFSNRSRTVGIKLHYLIPAALFGRYLNLVDRESSFFLVKCESERESEGEIYFVM